MAAAHAGERVIDVACGTGLVTFPIAQSVGSEGSVLGTDLSESMVNSSTEEAGRKGLPHASFRHMDAENLDVAHDSYDAALCSLGLMYFPDPELALGEMNRVLRPGGRAVVSVWGARNRCGWADIFPIVDSRVQSEVCPMFFRLGTGDNLENAVLAAGFVDAETARIRTTLHYESAEEACMAAFAGGPVALAYSRFDDRTREEVHAEYVRSIDPYRSGEAYAVPGEFVIVKASRK